MIDCEQAQVDTLLVDVFLEAHERTRREIVLDVDMESARGPALPDPWEDYC